MTLPKKQFRDWSLESKKASKPAKVIKKITKAESNNIKDFGIF